MGNTFKMIEIYLLHMKNKKTQHSQLYFLAVDQSRVLSTLSLLPEKIPARRKLASTQFEWVLFYIPHIFLELASFICLYLRK